MGLSEILVSVVILVTMVAALAGVLLYLKNDINKIQKRLNVDEESDKMADIRIQTLTSDLEKNYATQRQMKALGTDMDTRLNTSQTALTDQLTTMNTNTQGRITDFKTAMEGEVNTIATELRNFDGELDYRQRVMQEEMLDMGDSFDTRQITLDKEWHLQRGATDGNLVISNNVPNSDASVLVSTGLNVVGKLGFAAVDDGYSLGTAGEDLRLSLPPNTGKFHMVGADIPQHTFDASGNVMHMGDILAPGVSRKPDEKDWLHLNQRGDASEGTMIHGSIAADGGLAVGDWVKVPNGMMYVKEKLGVGTTTPTEALEVKGNARVNDLWIGSYVIFEENGHLYIGKDTKSAKILKVSGTDVYRLNTYNNVDGSAPGWGINNLGQSVAF